MKVFYGITIKYGTDFMIAVYMQSYGTNGSRYIRVRLDEIWDMDYNIGIWE